tara:strand:- start:2653 stop:3294 length:642 start_codon:yes stop_codon:yes gene_type:complete
MVFFAETISRDRKMNEKKNKQRKKKLDVSQPLPVTVLDATGKTDKRKTRTLNKANRAARGAELREDTLVGKAINRGNLGIAAMADVVRAASGTKKGSGPSSYMAPATRAGIKAAKIKKERGDKKMMGGGSLKMDKMKMAGGGMMEDMKAAGMKMAGGGKMPMDAKTGKPAFAVDGKGKMGHGGMAYGKKKMMDGGTIARGSGAARPQKFRKNG